MKIAIILGTRPEIIKMGPVIRECQMRGLNYFILHTGQHYTYEMDKIFFRELGLPRPKYNVNVGSGPHGRQTGKMLIGIEQVLLKEKPDVVLVGGDTNSALSGALVACKLHIKIGHVEAGLRSFDRRMPEEYNRMLTDCISDYLFAPTLVAKKNLLNEGIGRRKFVTSEGSEKARIFVTGNTVVDATLQNLKLAERSCKTLEELSLTPKKYFLVTSHRAENVDNKKFLQAFFAALKELSKEHGFPVVWPIHPRTLRRIKEFRMEKEAKEFNLIKPVGHLEFLVLENNARLILTDSGGVQEEACTLGTPCVVVRKTSERPETIAVGASALGKITTKEILAASHKMLEKKGKWKNPLGNGTTAKKLINILQKEFK